MVYEFECWRSVERGGANIDKPNQHPVRVRGAELVTADDVASLRASMKSAVARIVAPGDSENPPLAPVNRAGDWDILTRKPQNSSRLVVPANVIADLDRHPLIVVPWNATTGRYYA